MSTMGRGVPFPSESAQGDRVQGSTPRGHDRGARLQTQKLAFIWVGDLQYELIQPISGAVDVYRDALPADDGLQFHHICMRVGDWDEFRPRGRQPALPVVLEGGMRRCVSSTSTPGRSSATTSNTSG